MAYTIPEYVDTPEQAILAVASAVKGEAVTGGDGSVNTALDILADVLSGEDIEVPQTDAGAILALAQYVGGGGGPELGALGLVCTDTDGMPEVGNEAIISGIIDTVIIPPSVMAIDSQRTTIEGLFAAGLIVETLAVNQDYVDSCAAYICTLEGDSYATVTPWDGTLTRNSKAVGDDPAYSWTLTVPELHDGEMLVLYPYLAN